MANGPWPIERSRDRCHRHVTLKVKVATQICLRLNMMMISQTAQDSGLMSMEWLMTSRDPERSKQWPRYTWASISRNPLEIECQYQWTTPSKWPMANRTWSMSRDLGRNPNPLDAYYFETLQQLDVMLLNAWLFLRNWIRWELLWKQLLRLKIGIMPFPHYVSCR